MNILSFNKSSSITAIIFAALLCSSHLSAANTSNNSNEAVSWYQIEVIIFENLKHYELDKEHVVIEAPTNDQQFVLVQGKPMVSNQLQRLDTANLKLTKSYKALKRSKDYKVLEFAGWKQPLTKQQSDIPLLISAGQKYGEHSALEGTLTFKKSRYLHLHANLYLAEYSPGLKINLKSWLLENEHSALKPSQLIDTTTTPNTSQLNRENDSTQEENKGNANYVVDKIAHMDESRRMRSGEIHYLDHPKFGLMVTIEPTDPPFVYNAP